VKPGDVIEYRYDFGDNWLHELIIDAAEEAAAEYRHHGSFRISADSNRTASGS
jgi:hypothetical protein